MGGDAAVTSVQVGEFCLCFNFLFNLVLMNSQHCAYDLKRLPTPLPMCPFASNESSSPPFPVQRHQSQSKQVPQQVQARQAQPAQLQLDSRSSTLTSIASLVRRMDSQRSLPSQNRSSNASSMVTTRRSFIVRSHCALFVELL